MPLLRCYILYATVFMLIVIPYMDPLLLQETIATISDTQLLPYIRLWVSDLPALMDIRT